MGIPPGASPLDIALRGIRAFRAWCRSVGAPVTLVELGVKKESWRKHAENVARTPDGRDLGAEAVLKILSYASE